MIITYTTDDFLYLCSNTWLIDWLQAAWMVDWFYLVGFNNSKRRSLVRTVPACWAACVSHNHHFVMFATISVFLFSHNHHFSFFAGKRYNFGCHHHHWCCSKKVWPSEQRNSVQLKICNVEHQKIGDWRLLYRAGVDSITSLIADPPTPSSTHTASASPLKAVFFKTVFSEIVLSESLMWRSQLGPNFCAAKL